MISGTVEVIAPTEKVKQPRAPWPAAHLHERGVFYRHLVELARSLEPMRTAVVHPVDRNALLGAIDAAQAHLIVPILVGPAERICAVAAAEDLDLSPYTVISTEHSHAAAEQAVALAR